MSHLSETQLNAVYDSSELFKPILIAFNQTFNVFVQSYAITKSTFHTNRNNCDQEANEKADSIMFSARDFILDCYLKFQQEIISIGVKYEEMTDVRKIYLPYLHNVVLKNIAKKQKLISGTN